MATDVITLLRVTLAGDDAAWQLVLMHFRQHTFTLEEEDQVHRYLRQAARQHHQATYLQAWLYDYGYGVPQNSDMAFLFMREAAARGNALATYEVGRRFLHGIGVEANADNARQWLTLAAGSPHYISAAMFELGWMYDEGSGVERDADLAMTWYMKAANKGHEKAKEKLARGRQ